MCKLLHKSAHEGASVCVIGSYDSWPILASFARVGLVFASLFTSVSLVHGHARAENLGAASAGLACAGLESPWQQSTIQAP